MMATQYHVPLPIAQIPSDQMTMPLSIRHRKSHLRISVLTTSATSHQAAVQKMQRRFSIASQVPFLHPYFIYRYIVFDLHHTIFSLRCSIYRYKLSAGYRKLPTAVHSCSFSKYSQVLWRLPVLHTDLTAFTGSVAAGSHIGGYS